jgi:hypothetical protein
MEIYNCWEFFKIKDHTRQSQQKIQNCIHYRFDLTYLESINCETEILIFPCARN